MRLSSVFCLLTSVFCLSAQVRYEDILQSPGKNWLTYMGDYKGRRHSPLRQITPDNIKFLAPKWTYHIDGTRRLEATPLVLDGVMYVTASNEVHALDARTGRKIWAYRDEQAKSQRVNRGVALLGDRVFFVTGDAHLVALDRRTGGLLWQKAFADRTLGYGATLAPLALRDRVLVGVSGGDAEIDNPTWGNVFVTSLGGAGVGALLDCGGALDQLFTDLIGPDPRCDGKGYDGQQVEQGGEREAQPEQPEVPPLEPEQLLESLTRPLSQGDAMGSFLRLGPTEGEGE